MALKATVHERCDQCSARDARKVGAYVTRGLHRCPKAPPGPRGPAHRFHESDVVFVAGDFTADELRVELDEAWAMIDDLRKKRHEAERAASAAVTAVMREIYETH